MSENNKQRSIVFFGTPEFAAHILDYLVSEKYNIAGVVTVPDRPAGRGHKMQPSAVKVVAESNNLPLLQPESLKDLKFVSSLQAWRAEIFVVVAFRMLPKIVWNMPALGTFNLHASLLPAYRGAAPINRAIQNGETRTGITTFLLDEEIDTGRILLQEEVNIEPVDNAGSLHNKLMNRGKFLVAKTIDGLFDGTISDGIPQDPIAAAQAPSAPKIFKEDQLLSFTQSNAESLLLTIRAMSPYPAALAECEDEEGNSLQFKVYDAKIGDQVSNSAPGICETDGKSFLRVIAADGKSVELLELQPPSKKRMTIQAFLNGSRKNLLLKFR